MKPIAILYAAAGVAGAIAVAYIIYQVKTYGSTVADAAGEALQKVNPTNPENVVNQAANKVVQKVTGNDTDTIGTWIYRLTHKEIDPTAPDPKPGNPATPANTGSGFGVALPDFPTTFDSGGLISYETDSNLSQFLG